MPSKHMGSSGEQANSKKIRHWFREIHGRLQGQHFLWGKRLDRSDLSLISISLPDVCIRDTGTAKGRGVFSLRPFRSNEIVEICPVIVIEGDFQALPLELRRVVFSWTVLAAAPDNSHGLVLGYGSMYNHDNPANMTYSALVDQLAVRFTAARDISAGEELTINYNAKGGGAEWDNDNWFDRQDLKPIVGQ